METLIAHPANKEQLNALKAFMKALKVDSKVEKATYNPEFIAKIEQSRQEIKEGKGVRIKVEDLWKIDISPRALIDLEKWKKSGNKSSTKNY